VDELLASLPAAPGTSASFSQFAMIREDEADSGKLAAGPDPGVRSRSTNSTS
jgi:hypothetical protein